MIVDLCLLQRAQLAQVTFACLISGHITTFLPSGVSVLLIMSDGTTTVTGAIECCELTRLSQSVGAEIDREPVCICVSDTEPVLRTSWITHNLELLQALDGIRKLGIKFGIRSEHENPDDLRRAA